MSLDELLTICAVEEHRPCVNAAGWHQRRERIGWLWLADQVLGSWPRTLRASLVLALLLVALVVVLAILVGVRPALSVAGLYVLHRLILRWQVQQTRLA